MRSVERRSRFLLVVASSAAAARCLCAPGGVPLGLTVTFALGVYDQRNSRLHDELISRARRVEHELGVVVGQFLGRPGSPGVVKHDIAITTV